MFSLIIILLSHKKQVSWIEMTGFLVFLVFVWKGGLIYKAGGSNMQHVTSLSFLLLAYSNYLSHANKAVPCGETSATPALLKRLAQRQVSPIAQSWLW